MATEITADLLKKYMKPNNKRHTAYPETVALAHGVKIHANGEFPTELIDTRRPGESDTIKKYRKAIYKSKTKGAFGKVMTELGKIRKSEDWMIKYDDAKQIKGIREGETLFDYCELNFPLKFSSVTNWVFNVLLKSYVVDPNSVIVVMPLSIAVDESEYLKPFPFIFSSEQVYEYVDDDYCILYSTDKSTYTDGKETKTDGDIFYAINEEYIQRWEQTDAKGTMIMTVEFEHGLGKMPAFKIGAQFLKVYERHFIYESRLANCLPSWDEAVREYSDLQAEVVQHIHSLMWSYSNQVCNTCNSTGTVMREGKDSVQVPVQCEKCKGSGYIPFNPYEHLTIRPAAATEAALPNPFIGYVTKPTDIVKIQDERVKDHIYDGLAAINMEFLADTPLNESGKAKEVDRDGLNTFVSTIAEDLVRVMDMAYKLINDYRYTVTEPNEDKRDEQLPKIPVPQKFDLLDSAYLIDDVVKAKTSKASPSIITALEMEYVNAKFNNDDEVRNTMNAEFELDPFPGLSEDDKLSRLQNNGISEVDYIISSNIQSFVKRATMEDPKFTVLPYEQKMEKMKEYAGEIKTANSAKETVMRSLDGGMQGQGFGAQGAA